MNFSARCLEIRGMMDNSAPWQEIQAPSEADMRIPFDSEGKSLMLRKSKEITRKQILREKERERKRALREKEKKRKRILKEKGKKRNQVLREKENKKKRILKAALNLYGKNGFEKTTVEDITLKANVGKGTFYSFFEKKEDVLIYFLNKEIKKSLEEIELKVASKRTFFDQLELASSTLLKHVFWNKDLARILFKDRFIKWGMKENENEVKMIDAISLLINQAKQKKEIDPHAPTRCLAEMVHGINTMYIVYWINEVIKTKKALMEKIKEANKIIINGVRTKK